MSSDDKQALWAIAADAEGGRVVIHVAQPGYYLLIPEQARDLARELNAHALAVEAGVSTQVPQ